MHFFGTMNAAKFASLALLAFGAALILATNPIAQRIKTKKQITTMTLIIKSTGLVLVITGFLMIAV